MNNREWLYSLDVADLSDWFDAEHVEHQERALDGDTESENADSRERLEAEIESYSAFDMMDTITLDMVIEWLDRQAAITEEQARCKWVTASADEIAAWRSKAEKLKADLEAAYAKNRSLRQHISQMQNGRNEWHVKAVRLEKQLEATNKRCEGYRKKFGKCLDYADAIHALMDDEGMA